LRDPPRNGAALRSLKILNAQTVVKEGLGEECGNPRKRGKATTTTPTDILKVVVLVVAALRAMPFREGNRQTPQTPKAGETVL
jgi:hypothetical protein